jgi:CRP/FNR family transcriptional regulator, cyclic AMP receptor protein
VASAAGTAATALVLEVDPDLGRNIDPVEWELARQACRADLLSMPRGPWPATSDDVGGGGLVAFVILEGLLARELSVQDRCMVELLGGGDVLLRPVVTDGPRFATETRLTAVSDLLVLVLDQPFIRAAARWPTLLTALHRRLEAQRESLAIQGLIAHLQSAEHRVLLMLRHLADRWGYVMPEGIVLPLQLSHEILGRLSAARRPTVTLAVRHLEAGGAIQRRGDGSWLLTGAGERMINTIAGSPSVAHSVGEQLMLYRQVGQTRAQNLALRAEARQIRSQHPAQPRINNSPPPA